MELNDSTAKTIDTVEQSDIESLRAQLRSEHDMYLRSIADFDNYRRRAERDFSSAVERGKRGLLLASLEVVDSLDSALQQVSGAPAALLEGLAAIHRKAITLLEKEGVTPYKSIGEPFNPAVHEAVASVVSDQHAPGIVVEELQPGYRAGDTVLRPARVRVSSQP